MFCVQLEGSHTCCRQKGESAGYQARKKAVTTNSIFLCDNKEQMIVMGSPKAGNHNDLYEIEEVLKEILVLLDNPRNREQPYVYFDEELYKIMFNEQVLVAYPLLIFPLSSPYLPLIFPLSSPYLPLTFALPSPYLRLTFALPSPYLRLTFPLPPLTFPLSSLNLTAKCNNYFLSLRPI